MDECAARCAAENYETGFIVGVGGSYVDWCYCRDGDTAFTLSNDDTDFVKYKFVYQCECGDIVPPFHEVAHQGECEQNGGEWEVRKTSGDASVEACANACVGTMIGDKPVLGFAYKPGYCFCEANPSHPDPDCGWAHPGDDYVRYDFTGENVVQASTGYIVREYEDNVYRHTDFTTPYKNPKPCEIDTYLSYPDMDRDCHCPIWHFEESMVKDDAEAYSIPLDAPRANLHSCVEECTSMKKRTARFERAQNFTCFCGDTYADDGVAGYKLSHTRFARAQFEGGACMGEFEMITDPEECKLAAEIIGGMPTEVQDPSVLPNSYCTDSAQEYGGDATLCAREGCGHYEYGEYDLLIMGYHTEASTRPQYSTQLCKHKQECKCPGFYMQGGHAYSCKAGTYSDGACSSRCKVCPVGKSSSEGATSCETCPGGKIQASETSCVNCPAGYFSSEGDLQCTECAFGEFASAGSEICTDCPRVQDFCRVIIMYGLRGGQVSKLGDTSCSDCAAGTYSNTAAASCTTCPGGWAQSSGGKYSSAQPDTFRSLRATCSDCAIGKFSNAEASTCSSCPTGYFQSSSGQSSCTGCSDSEYQDQEGQVSCKSCGSMILYFFSSLRLNGDRVRIKSRFPTASRCVIARRQIRIG